MIVLGIDTSTAVTSIALGTQQAILGSASFAGARKHDEVVPAIEQLLAWTGEERRVVVEAEGDPWGLRWERLERALEPWSAAA